MKYWLLTTEFPPMHGGGISTYCRETVQMLAENGHELRVFLYDNSIAGVLEEVKDNYTLVRFNPNRGEVSGFLGWDANVAFAYADVLGLQIEKHGKPDVLETQDYLGIGYFIQQKSWLNYPAFTGFPIVVCMHAPSFLYLQYNQGQAYRLPNYFTGEMEKASMAMADLLLSPSSFLIDKLKEKHVQHLQKAVQLFNPFSEFKVPAKKDFTEGELVFFGKMTPQKGCLQLFSNLKQMWDAGFDKKLKVLGGGDHFFYPQQMDMQEFIEQKYAAYVNKGLIEFAGKISPAQIANTLKSAHVVLVPSIVDNLPYAVIEAMAEGKVVLASDAGGQKELIEDGETGFLFSHEKNDFAKKLEHILELPADQILEIGSNACRFVQRELSPSKIYQQKMERIKAVPKRGNNFPFVAESLKPSVRCALSYGKKLTVVVPFYNLLKTLPATLESLGKVEYPDMEVLLINDGSTEEGAEEQLNLLQKKYGFELYNKSNTGLSETRNFGAEKAKGDFLAFLDADDTVEPGYYKKAIEVLSSYDDLHFVGCWAKYFGQNESIWPAFNPEPPYLLFHNMINSSALIYKKESFLNFGRNKKKMEYGMEDYESVINMVENGARGVALPEILWNYRIRKNSMQQAFNRNKQLFLYEQIANNHAEFYNMYGAELSKLYNHNGPGFRVENPTLGPVEEGRLMKLIPPRVLLFIKHNIVLRRMGKAIYRRLNRN